MCEFAHVLSLTLDVLRPWTVRRTRGANSCPDVHPRVRERAGSALRLIRLVHRLPAGALVAHSNGDRVPLCLEVCCCTIMPATERSQLPAAKRATTATMPRPGDTPKRFDTPVGFTVRQPAVVGRGSPRQSTGLDAVPVSPYDGAAGTDEPRATGVRVRVTQLRAVLRRLEGRQYQSRPRTAASNRAVSRRELGCDEVRPQWHRPHRAAPASEHRQA